MALEKENIENREIYDLNPMFNVIFNRWNKPWRYWIITLILLTIILIPGIIFKNLYFPEQDLVGTIEGITFISILITPLSLFLMDKVYHRWKNTFKEVRLISSFEKQSDYDDMLYKYNTRTVKLLLWGTIVLCWCYMIYQDYLHIVNADWWFGIDQYDLTTRIIIVIPYTIAWIVLIPIYISYGLNLVMMTLIINNFSKKIKIPPGLFDRENACGLKPLSRLTMIMSASPLIMAFIVIWNITVTGRSIYQTQNLLSLLIVIVGMFIIFILPLITTHQVMVREKTKELNKLSNKLESLYKRYNDIDTHPNKNEEANEIHTEINTLGLLISKIEDMREWPFDVGIWIQFVTLILLPIILMIIQMVITEYLL